MGNTSSVTILQDKIPKSKTKVLHTLKALERIHKPGELRIPVILVLGGIGLGA